VSRDYCSYTFDLRYKYCTSFNTLRDVIEISLHQAKNFAGNCYEVVARNQNGGSTNHVRTQQDGAQKHAGDQNGVRKLIISTRGWSSLSPAQQDRISGLCEVISCPVDTIEDVGGGGVRCMLTGVFNPPL
jgi:hypothetical protein